MIDFQSVVEATFQKRVNRFVAEVTLLDGSLVQVHVANTGRMRELLVAGRRCLLHPASNPARKTAWDLLAVDKDGQWVCLIAAWANDFVEQWLKQGYIKEFDHCSRIQREKKIGHSRFDFALEQDDCQWLVEVKSVNYVVEGHGLFPDAPTSRGRRHVEELMELKKQGWQVGIFFVVMGQPVTDVSFNKVNDPKFAEVMTLALADGVMVKAFSSRIVPPNVEFCGECPII